MHEPKPLNVLSKTNLAHQYISTHGPSFSLSDFCMWSDRGFGITVKRNVEGETHHPVPSKRTAGTTPSWEEVAEREREGIPYGAAFMPEDLEIGSFRFVRVPGLSLIDSAAASDLSVDVFNRLRVPYLARFFPVLVRLS